MRSRSRSLAVVAVPVWGPEPLGASTVDSLDTHAGLQLSGAAVRPYWGAAGSVETTDTHIFQSPQTFRGLGGVVSPSPPDLSSLLPNTSAPGGFYAG